MSSVSDVKDEVIALLWRGDQKAARLLINEERERLNQLMRELDELLPGSRNVVVGAVGKANGTTAEKIWDEDAVAERRNRVVELANSQMSMFGLPIMVEKIQENLDAEGFDLGVQENRKTTAISSILRHSGQFQRVSKGRFTPKEETL